MKPLVRGALDAAKVPASAVEWQDTGDGFVLTIAPMVSSAVIVADFVHHLRVAQSGYNQVNDGSGRLRLRLALHHGNTVRQGTGWAGPAVIVGARLADSEPVRKALRDHATADLALIVSSALFDDTVKERFLGLEPASFQEVDVRLKSFEGRAYLTLPGYGTPPGSTGPNPTAGGSGGPESSPSRLSERPADRSGEPHEGVTEWDFFVSVAGEDSSWGRWITWYLEQEGYVVQLEEWDVQVGRFDPRALDDAVRYSKRTIVVLSSHYLSSSKVEAAWQHAWNLDRVGLERRLIPVRVEECEPKGLLGGIKYIDLVGRREDDAKVELVEQIRRAVKGSYRPTTAPPFPVPRS